jgi:hypothetical protein
MLCYEQNEMKRRILTAGHPHRKPCRGRVAAQRNLVDKHCQPHACWRRIVRSTVRILAMHVLPSLQGVAMNEYACTINKADGPATAALLLYPEHDNETSLSQERQVVS